MVRLCTRARILAVLGWMGVEAFALFVPDLAAAARREMILRAHAMQNRRTWWRCRAAMMTALFVEAPAHTLVFNGVRRRAPRAERAT